MQSTSAPDDSSPSSSLSSASVNKDKWTCGRCTYENWMASKRCTMCRAENNNKVIAENQHNNRKLGTDIYKMGATSLSRSSSPQNCNSDDNLHQKWPCQMCTYLNWPKALRCTQCLTPRRRASPAVSRNTIPGSGEGIPDLKELRITCNRPKWNCGACTVENGPRNKKCYLCGTARELPAETAARDSPPPTGAMGRPAKPASSAPTEDSNWEYERRVRQFRQRLREADWSWLTACMGVVEADMNPVEAYLNTGGDPTRKLTNPEVALLNRPSVYETGHTLVHLAIKFHREDMLAKLLSQLEGGVGSSSGIKCVPSYVAPDLASAIRRHISQCLRQRKGPISCFYISEIATYTLPPEIQDLPAVTQEQLYSEVMDRDAQRELEEESDIINWSEEVKLKLGSRLHALWNRSSGDCLLDSVLQATWGVFDRENTLRRAMSDSLHEAAHLFYPRWREWEMQQALELDYTLDEAQLAEDWAGLLNLASQPGASLEQLHVFCLAHVLRRPILVYGVKYVKSWRGENLGYARFEGVYLPLMWEPSFCSRSPIALGYTRGHFCALVTPEPVHRGPQVRHHNSGAGGASYVEAIDGDDVDKATFLPLMTADRKRLLPVHFLSQSEVGNEEVVLGQWLDVCATDSGLVVAQQRMAKPPLLVAQMTEEWLNHYRKLAQSSVAPFNTRVSSGASATTAMHHSPALRSSPTMISACSSSNNIGNSSTNAHNICNSSTKTNPILVAGSVANTGGGYSSDGDSDEE